LDEQRRLADAGVAADQDDRRLPAVRALDGALQRRELFLASDHQGLRSAACHHSAVSRAGLSTRSSGSEARRRMRAHLPYVDRAPQSPTTRSTAMHAFTPPAATAPGTSRWTRLLRGPAMDAASIHRRRWWTLAILNLSLFAIIMDNTILNVALPTLARDLQASGSDLQWIVDSYVLVFA